MKKLWSFLSRFEVSLLTPPILALAIFSGRYRPLFLHLFATLIHEMGHVLAASIFHVPIKKVTFLPFGFYAELGDLDDITPLKEFLIMIAGPCMFFVNLLLFWGLARLNFISMHSLQQANAANELILFFNLLPIYPLDGSRILHLGLQYFLPMKQSYRVLSFFSFFGTIAIFLLTMEQPQYLILGFLLLINIKMFRAIPVIHLRFLWHRMGQIIDYKPKIHQKIDIYRPYRNIYFSSQGIYEEPEFVTHLLDRTLGQKKNDKYGEQCYTNSSKFVNH